MKTPMQNKSNQKPTTKKKTQWSRPENTDRHMSDYISHSPLIIIYKYFIIKIIVLNIQTIADITYFDCTYKANSLYQKINGRDFELGRNYKYKCTFLNNLNDVRIMIILKLSQN